MQCLLFLYLTRTVTLKKKQKHTHIHIHLCQVCFCPLVLLFVCVRVFSQKGGEEVVWFHLSVVFHHHMPLWTPCDDLRCWWRQRRESCVDDRDERTEGFWMVFESLPPPKKNGTADRWLTVAWPDRPRCGTYILPTVASLLEMQRLKGNPTSQNLKPIGEFNQEIQTSWLYRNSPSALIGSWHHFYTLSALSICTVLCSSWLWLWVRDSIQAREGTLKSFLTVWFSFYILLEEVFHPTYRTALQRESERVGMYRLGRSM